MAGLLGCGELFFNRSIGGVSQGWKRFGNATKFEIKTNSTLKERKSKACATYGQVVDSVSIKEPDDLSITLDDLNAENLAAIFLGTSSGVSVAAGTVTAEAQTYNDGALVQTANGNISSVVVKDVTDTTTYVAGTDYNVVNSAIGFIEIISTGAITAGDVLHIDYAYGTITADKVQGGTRSNVNMALMLVGKNLVDDTNMTVNVWDATLSPNAAIDFLSDDFSTAEFDGRINLDATKGNGFEVEINRVLA